MRTRGITIYQETLIPRKKSNGTVLGDPIRTRRKGLAAWLVDDLTGIPLWAENSGCMFWKPHGSMFTRQGGSRYIGKPRLRLLWIGIIDPHSYCPSRPIRLLRFNGNQHIFFSGWCFGTCFMTFHSVGNVWNVIIPTDELHHFSRWLLHHQPDYY